MMYTILVDEKVVRMDSRALLRKMNESNIQVRPFWHPIHSLPPYQGAFPYRIEVANWLYRDGLSLPCSVGLSPEQQEAVIHTVRQMCDLIY